MLLLFGSLPLSGVFADDDTNHRESDLQEAVIEQSEEKTSELRTVIESELSETESEIAIEIEGGQKRETIEAEEESTTEVNSLDVEDLTEMEDNTEEITTEIFTEEISEEIDGGINIETGIEETQTEETTTEEAHLDSYLLGGNESITITRNDANVIKQGTVFACTYFVSLNNYYECAQNLEADHFLQAIYVIRQGDNVIQSGNLMLGRTGGDSFQAEYLEIGEYTIEIKASAYEERNGEYVWISDKELCVVTDHIEKTKIQLYGSIEKDGNFFYRDNYDRSVMFLLKAEGFDSKRDGDICYMISSSNEAVISLTDKQEVYSLQGELPTFVITGVGQAELIIQPLEHDFYTMEEFRIPIQVENSSMRDTDFCILYTDGNGEETLFQNDYGKWLNFLEEQKNWLNGSISIQLSEAGKKYYTGLGYVTNQEEDAITEETELLLSEESCIQQYDFWCSNQQKNAATNKQQNGTRSFAIGIDKTAPQNTEISYNQNFYKPTSTEATRYYGENLVITGSFEDALSGVKSIEYTTQADLGEQAQWMTISNITKDGNKAGFELILEHGCFTGIAIRATDIAGNISEAVELKNTSGEYLTMIVDKTQPELLAMSKTVDEKSYRGAWTNQPITIVVQESTKDRTLSGIQTMQYQYVSIGGKYQPDCWEELDTDGVLKLGQEETVKTDHNGTYYFRAISNTGVVTAVESQEANAIRVRLQQTMAEKEGIIETASVLDKNQTWYNRKTGVPVLEFLYPEYDNGVKSLEYDAPITIHTRLTAKFAKEKEMIPVYKTATIGIASDSVYQSLCKGENNGIEDSLQDLIIDFSYDKKTGYAMDGIYELEYWITDAAGNESSHDMYTYQIDTHEPDALEILVDGTPMKEDTSQTISFERFYQSAVSGSASADFGISGKGTIKLMLADEIGDWEQKQNWIYRDSFSISPCNRGCIYMIAEDAAGNQSILRTQGIVVDNQPPKGENGGEFISILTKANENNFYNKDIELRITASDLPEEKGFSALESVTYHIGSENKELFSFTKEFPGKEEIIAAQCFETIEIIDAVVYEGNDTYVEITATDRCGNTATSCEEFKIDVTAPTIEITFDQQEPQNGCFYQTARTATIHIEELNFDAQGIELEITRDQEPYEIPISDWQGDGSSHWATVAFLEDGDYTMTVSCTDLADNTSEEVSVEPFTIDLTKPEIEICYDNNEAKHDLYYQKPRVAKITVKEHNFREEDFILTAEPEVSMSEWSHDGDEHWVQITFAEDNHYCFTYTYTDLAGNEADVPQEQEFYIDSIPPQIVIHGVENESANAGEIHPIVTVYDRNHSKDEVNVTVTTGMGKSIPLTIQMQQEEQGYSYMLTDMSEKEDAIYYMTVSAQDMAGNQSELIYRFSLNRHGSTYDLTQISQTTERVYNRFDQITDLCITEMNVDEIEEYSIYITRNGKMLDCQETQKRPESNDKKEEVCYYVESAGNEQTGYTNRYIFYQENFAQEGNYRITCYSKDRAGNETNNTLEDKKAEVSFVVDNTAPKVMIDGIEPGGIYNEEAQTVHIMVQDNFCLNKAYFILVNEAGEELQSWDYMELAGEAGETVSITIPSLEEKQSLLYCVSDAAGNETVLLPDSEETPKGFLITTNPWLQFISSPIKVIGAICVVVGFLTAGAAFICKKHSQKAKMTK